MSCEQVLTLLGLAKRAGRVCAGEDMTREAVADHKARLLLLAADAGDAVCRRAERMRTDKLPLVRLSAGKEALGAALGRESCAVCAVTDLGFAARMAALLAQQDETIAPVAAELERRQAKALRRKKEKPRRKH